MSWDPNQQQQNYDNHYGGYHPDQQGYAGQQGGYGGGPQQGYGAPPPQGGYGAPPPNQGGYGGDGQFYGGGGGGWGGPQQGGGPPTLNLGGTQLPLDPMVTNMAMTYGADIVNQKKKEVEGMLDKYVSVGQLKYYFAVDNSYVTSKLRLLLFPFIHNDWSIRYNQDEPVQPRFELNAADLYIPSMAFVTFLLAVGYVLGLQDRFSPEVLATTASSALTALVLEILVVYISITVMAITTTLAKWDFLAFSMYKYVGMICCIFVGLVGGKAYYLCLAYTAAALALFLFRTLHLRVEPEVHGVENHGKRKLWLLFIMAGWQPLVMWWLTYSLVPGDVSHSAEL